jgi:acetyl esterase/lipase
MNKRNLLLALWAMLTISLYSCSKGSNQLNPAEGAAEEINISYGQDQRHKLDVLLPKGRNHETPFLLIIHDGNWTSGDKTDLKYFQDSLMRRGIATAAMNFRYASNNIHYPEMMADIDEAIQYCRSRAKSWNVRIDKVMLCGRGSGGHMALLYSYNYDTENRVAAVISAAGPTDITQTDWLNYSIVTGLIKNIELMVGAKHQIGLPVHARFIESSPRHHIKSVPTLLLHGTSDLIVPFSQSKALSDDLTGAGYINKLVRMQGIGHDLNLQNLDTYQLILTEVETWCKAFR